MGTLISLLQNYETINKKCCRECYLDVETCDEVQILVSVMKTYNYQDDLDIGNIDIDQILNSFLHLMQLHNSEDEYELLFNKFDLISNCKLNECNIWRRHYTHRADYRCGYFHQESYDTMSSAVVQILDKIHCYYIHSFDIGHKLSARDRNILKYFSMPKQNGVDYTMINTYETLSYRHKQYKHMRYRNNAISNANKFITAEMYQPGFTFCYGYKDEKYTIEHHSAGNVSQKYSCLKHELTLNSLSIMTMEQFSAELCKANIHYRSLYCKQYTIKYETWWDEQNPVAKENYPKQQLKPEHILATMIYCNYDTLQHEFSKTYRKLKSDESTVSIAKRHEEFYHLAKNLKQIVHWFGERTEYGCKKSVYHGVSELLVLNIRGNHLNFMTPLSTSIELPVAINFAGNEGIIIEINLGRTGGTHFSCAWLSDYSNEQEILFVQNTFVVTIVNITICKSGCDLNSILEVMNILDTNSDSASLSNEVKLLTQKLIENELGIKDFESLSGYAKCIFHRFCLNKEFLNVCWNSMVTKYSFLFKYYCLNNIEWINMMLLLKLYPNVKYITVHNINISRDALSTVLCNLKCLATSVSQIRIYGIRNWANIQSLISKWKVKFEALHLILYHDKKLKGILLEFDNLK
eukprot:521479_1